MYIENEKIKQEYMKYLDLGKPYTCYTENVMASRFMPIVASSAQNAMVNLSSRDSLFYSFSVFISTNWWNKKATTRKHKALRAARKKENFK